MRDTGRRIDVPVAFLTWLAAWLLGQVAALVVYSAGGYEDLDEVPIWVLFVTQVVIWGIFVAGMVLASRLDLSPVSMAQPTINIAPASTSGSYEFQRAFRNLLPGSSRRLSAKNSPDRGYAAANCSGVAWG